MTHDEVPTEFPFVAYIDGPDWSTQEVTILAYDLTGPNCTVKSFLVQEAGGAKYRASVGSFFLTKVDLVVSMRSEILDSVRSAYDAIDALNTETLELIRAYVKLEKDLK